jgi:hypothetical protein
MAGFAAEPRRIVAENSSCMCIRRWTWTWPSSFAATRCGRRWPAPSPRSESSRSGGATCAAASRSLRDAFGTGQRSSSDGVLALAAFTVMIRWPTGALAAVGLLAVPWVVSGCGETASAHLLRTNGTITKTEATNYAQSVNLIPADVPEMVSIGFEGDQKEASSLIDTTCGLRESHTHVADVKSPTFRSGGNGGGVPLQEVKSDVEVVRTAALADRKLTIIHADIQSARKRACLERVYGQTFAKGLSKGRTRFSLGRTIVSPLHPTLPRSFGIRVVIPFTFTINGMVVHTGLYVDGFGFIVGPAGVSLTTLRFTYPVPASTEQRLLSLLYGRAKS